MFPLYLKRRKDDEAPEESVAYVVGRKGIYLQRRTVAFRATYKSREAPMLEEVQEGAEYLLPPLPPTTVARTLTFFREVYRRERSEAIVLLAWEAASQRFELVCPPQEVDAAYLSYEVPRLTDGLLYVGSIHSHGSMSAFHSETDRDDEAAFEGIHVTIGRVDDEAVDASAELVIAEHRFKQSIPDALGGMRWVEATPIVAPQPEQPVITIEGGTHDGGGITVIERVVRYIRNGRVIQRRRRHPVGFVGERGLARAAPPPTSVVMRYRAAGYVLDLPPDVDPKELEPDPAWLGLVRKRAPRVVVIATPAMNSYDHYLSVNRVGVAAASPYPFREDDDLDGWGVPGEQPGITQLPAPAHGPIERLLDGRRTEVVEQEGEGD